MNSFLDVAPLLHGAKALPPLSEVQLQIWQPVIYQELAALRAEVRDRYGEDFKASESMLAWLKERLLKLQEPTQRYLAWHWSWL